MRLRCSIHPSLMLFSEENLNYVVTIAYFIILFLLFCSQYYFINCFWWRSVTTRIVYWAGLSWALEWRYFLLLFFLAIWSMSKFSSGSFAYPPFAACLLSYRSTIWVASSMLVCWNTLEYVYGISLAKALDRSSARALSSNLACSSARERSFSFSVALWVVVVSVKVDRKLECVLSTTPSSTSLSDGKLLLWAF